MCVQYEYLFINTDNETSRLSILSVPAESTDEEDRQKD